MVQERGWAGLKNGPLLRLMREAGVEAFVTTHRNLEYQQNVAAAGFAVVVLVPVTNTHQDLLPLVPALLLALEHSRPGQVTVRVSNFTLHQTARSQCLLAAGERAR